MRNNITKTIKIIILSAAAILLIIVAACRSTKQPTANKAPETQPATQANTNTAPSPFNVKESVVIERTSPFNHTRPEHQTKTKDCAFCHQRTDNSVTPTFPGH